MENENDNPHQELEDEFDKQTEKRISRMKRTYRIYAAVVGLGALFTFGSAYCIIRDYKDIFKQKYATEAYDSSEEGANEFEERRQWMQEQLEPIRRLRETQKWLRPLEKIVGE